MKIFLSGPMTGYDNFNFPTFDLLAWRLEGAGHQVVNPASIARKFKLEEVLSKREVFDAMVQAELDAERGCDAILLLDGWQKSKGVRAELKLAIEQDMKIFIESDIESDFK